MGLDMSWLALCCVSHVWFEGFNMDKQAKRLNFNILHGNPTYPIIPGLKFAPPPWTWLCHIWGITSPGWTNNPDHKNETQTWEYSLLWITSPKPGPSPRKQMSPLYRICMQVHIISLNLVFCNKFVCSQLYLYTKRIYKTHIYLSISVHT